MAEYIEREALFRSIADDVAPFNVAMVFRHIHNAPAADVAPVVHGRWILERDPNGKPYCFHCSVCDSDYHYIGIMAASDYCPNCGAKMDGDGNADH